MVTDSLFWLVFTTQPEKRTPLSPSRVTPSPSRGTGRSAPSSWNRVKVSFRVTAALSPLQVAVVISSVISRVPPWRWAR